MTGLDNELQAMENACSGTGYGRGTGDGGSRSADLSKEMIEGYINKIEVYDEQHIEIRWKRRKENRF